MKDEEILSTELSMPHPQRPNPGILCERLADQLIGQELRLSSSLAFVDTDLPDSAPDLVSIDSNDEIFTTSELAIGLESTNSPITLDPDNNCTAFSTKTGLLAINRAALVSWLSCFLARSPGQFLAQFASQLAWPEDGAQFAYRRDDDWLIDFHLRRWYDPTTQASHSHNSLQEFPQQFHPQSDSQLNRPQSDLQSVLLQQESKPPAPMDCHQLRTLTCAVLQTKRVRNRRLRV
ncbi:unnamed protein product [Protopolystoma xenopodis]|uniref:Uncharacterized protein n=1 Tax=Protopolystoma xenopodis TaxID=117903 RepID=A0A448WQR9_9PLAT|nr:unnamed protein product [Protopolystoma xenopodis]